MSARVVAYGTRSRGSMNSMNATGYRLLGYAVWRGGKWYLRQRLPSRRSLALTGLATAGTLGAAAAVARRLAA